MPSTQKTIKVLIADDATEFRDGVKDLFEDEGYISVVGEAADGQEAVEMAKRLHPDVVLMDLQLPRLDGVTATRIIRNECPQTNVLVVSGFDDEAHMVDAIRAGANGYLSKVRPAAELVSAIKALNGEVFIIPQAMKGIIVRGLAQAAPAGAKNGEGCLTSEEMLAMGLLCRGNSSREIADILKCGVDTVMALFGSIFRKLPVPGTPPA